MVYIEARQCFVDVAMLGMQLLVIVKHAWCRFVHVCETVYMHVTGLFMMPMFDAGHVMLQLFVGKCYRLVMVAL